MPFFQFIMALLALFKQKWKENIVDRLKMCYDKQSCNIENKHTGSVRKNNDKEKSDHFFCLRADAWRR